MHRKVIHEWFDTTKGQILQQQETAFLKHSITVSCKQIIVQIGALGWENDFIDCSLYEQFYVLDDEQDSCYESKLVRGSTIALPFKSESVDMVILPHVLEFSQHKHRVLREVERILKPEGKLTILSFNPWNIYINLQYIKRRKKHTRWFPDLVSRTRIEDWLRLLNFEVDVAAGFNFDTTRINSEHAESRKQELRVAAYGIKAIKRCYHLIPLTPIRDYQSKYAMAKIIDIPIRQRQYNAES
ncbi:MAG TPA: class I SAM-dependent methyltransferase [Methyloprofundus sp.]|uniref:class I SAM-dependent methyltransferase n=1 Tax=Methyloprofundus sp. TaxID=2020875 RepID=UPI0017FE9115|nr:methyltransferase domain-containing protein [Methyloprofundus sp.]HIG64955.1 class I SAM-dependent methyltransferase [Methyloprofundus sp.]HIL79117.1 class I SAM-dependent methyltransferase [Methylococcales bacterium]